MPEPGPLPTPAPRDCLQPSRADLLGTASQVVGEDYELDPLQPTYLLSRAETIYRTPRP